MAELELLTFRLLVVSSTTELLLLDKEASHLDTT